MFFFDEFVVKSLYYSIGFVFLKKTIRFRREEGKKEQRKEGKKKRKKGGLRWWTTAKHSVSDTLPGLGRLISPLDFIHFKFWIHLVLYIQRPGSMT